MNLLTPFRLEMVRLTRQWCYTKQELVDGGYIERDAYQDKILRTLDTPVEVLAAWVDPTESVYANIRLLTHMATEESMPESWYAGLR